MKYVFKSISVLMFEDSNLSLSNNDEVDIEILVKTPSFMYIDITKNNIHIGVPVEPNWFNRFFRKEED